MPISYDSNDQSAIVNILNRIPHVLDNINLFGAAIHLYTVTQVMAFLGETESNFHTRKFQN